jgi:hypothetical protein
MFDKWRWKCFYILTGFQISYFWLTNCYHSRCSANPHRSWFLLPMISFIPFPIISSHLQGPKNIECPMLFIPSCNSPQFFQYFNKSWSQATFTYPSFPQACYLLQMIDNKLKVVLPLRFVVSLPRNLVHHDRFFMIQPLLI